MRSIRPRDLSSLDVLHRSMARWNSLDVSMVMEGTGWRRRQREHRALLPLEVVSEGAGEAVSVSSAPSRGNRIQSHRLGELGLWKRPPSAPGEGPVRLEV
ncbi:unnamed protein product [Durusdinium trenchii]|uniref:Uncharacterized protein n=1 Tax=Durusdinium trenchii TaxID=1381693 RepID=A0ABP0KJC1_9DINO